MAPHRNLSELRAAIDAVDSELLRLLDRRAQLATEVGETKRAQGAPFYAPERERAIVERLTGTNGLFPRDALRVVLREVISACLALERPLRVGYVGPEGSLTQAACRRRFGLSARLIPAPSAASVLADIATGAVDLGVVPVESTEHGSFAATLDALATSPLTAVAEVTLASGLVVLSQGGNLAGVTAVMGTPTALQEARAFLGERLPGATLAEVPAAALACERAREEPHTAAIAPRALAALFDLEMAAPIEPGPSITRFIVMGRESAARSGRDRTSLVLSMLNQTGAMYRLLAPFAERGVNVLQLESRPLRGRPFDYVFFLDLEGHVDDPPVAAAIEAARTFVTSLRVLGSYPREEPGA